MRATSIVIQRLLGALALGFVATIVISGGGSRASAQALAFPTLSIADASVVEGTGAGTTTIDLVVSTSALYPVECGFRAVLTHGTTSDADFTSTAFFDVTAVWDTDDQNIPRSFGIARDVFDEPNETFTLTLSPNPLHAVPCSIDDGVAIGTITDDDLAPPDEQGNTHGYWKTHLQAWPAPYTPGTTLEGAGFRAPACAGFDSLDLVRPNGTDTLLQALGYQGGSLLVDKGRILLRAAVAALLNEASYGPSYPAYPSTAALIAAVNQTLGTCSREAYTALAVELDRSNQGRLTPG